jgi:tetratricopeptide (TPR) repeat protein
MKTNSKLLIFVIIFLALTASAYAQSPRDELKQMIEQLQKNPTDNAVREKIIKLATSLKPTPAIPEEARKPFVMGATVLKRASDPAGASKAVDLFTQALDIAPWFADAYYNRALAREAAGQYESAIDDLKFYLQFKLTVAEHREVQDKIYSLDADAQLASVKKAEQDKIASAENAKRQAQQNLIAALKAEYERLKTLVDGRVYENYLMCSNCDQAKASGNNWYSPPDEYQFILTGAVKLYEDADPRVEVSFVQTGGKSLYNGLNYIFLGRPSGKDKELNWKMKSRWWGKGDQSWWHDEAPTWLYLSQSKVRWCENSECAHITTSGIDPWSVGPSANYTIIDMDRR